MFPIYCDLSTYQFQEPLVVHLFVGDIRAIVEDGIGGDGGWSVLCFLFALQMDGLERNPLFLGYGFKNRHILPIERTLVGIVQDIAALRDMQMLCTLLEARDFGICRKFPSENLERV